MNPIVPSSAAAVPSPSRRAFVAGLGVGTLALVLAACGRSASSSSASAPAATPSYYTCSMHPQVHSNDPQGHCPICGMNLVPVYGKTEGQ